MTSHVALQGPIGIFRRFSFVQENRPTACLLPHCADAGREMSSHRQLLTRFPLFGRKLKMTVILFYLLLWYLKACIAITTALITSSTNTTKACCVMLQSH